MNHLAHELSPSCALLLTLTVVTLFGQSTHKLDPSTFDKNTAACTDFYQYVNGGWLAANPIPLAFPSWSLGNILNEKEPGRAARHPRRSGAEPERKKGKQRTEGGRLLRQLHGRSEDRSRSDSKPLAAEFDRIARINSQQTLQEVIAHLHYLGINALFVDGSNQDAKNSAEVTAGIFQGGLGLPERDYYTKTDERSKMTSGSVPETRGEDVRVDG